LGIVDIRPKWNEKRKFVRIYSSWQ